MFRLSFVFLFIFILPPDKVHDEIINMREYFLDQTKILNNQISYNNQQTFLDDQWNAEQQFRNAAAKTPYYIYVCVCVLNIFFYGLSIIIIIIYSTRSSSSSNNSSSSSNSCITIDVRKSRTAQIGNHCQKSCTRQSPDFCFFISICTRITLWIFVTTFQGNFVIFKFFF